MLGCSKYHLTRDNLVTHHDRSGGKDFKETFIYDALNRMVSSQLTVVINGSSQTAGLESASYDAAGNLQTKAGQSYTYGYEAGCTSTNAGPHAVCSKGGVTYQYDVTGNMVSDTSGCAMTYSVFHKPTQVSSQSGSNITQY